MRLRNAKKRPPDLTAFQSVCKEQRDLHEGEKARDGEKYRVRI